MKKLFFATCLSLILAGSLQAECAKCRILAGFGLATIDPSEASASADEKVKGQVLSVQEVAPANGVYAGVYLLVKTKDYNWPVRLTSLNSLKSKGIDIQPFDEIQVTGRTIKTAREKPAIIATEIQYQGKTVQIQ